MLKLLINFFISYLRHFDAAWRMLPYRQRRGPIHDDCIQKYNSGRISIEKHHIQLCNLLDARHQSELTPVAFLFECD